MCRRSYQAEVYLHTYICTYVHFLTYKTNVLQTINIFIKIRQIYFELYQDYQTGLSEDSHDIQGQSFV